MHHFLFTSHACYFVSGDVTYFLHLYSLQNNSIDMFTVQYNFFAFFIYSVKIHLDVDLKESRYILLSLYKRLRILKFTIERIWYNKRNCKKFWNLKNVPIWLIGCVLCDVLVLPVCIGTLERSICTKE